MSEVQRPQHPRKRPPPRSNNSTHGQRRGQNFARSTPQRRRGSGGNDHAPAAPPPCAVCAAATPKYKCPTCRAPYCSIACCRQHKKAGCVKPVEEAKDPSQTKYSIMGDGTEAVVSPPLPEPGTDASSWMENFEDLEEGWMLTDEMKEELHDSGWLASELQDQGLQKLLQTIVRGSANVSRHGDGATEQEQLLWHSKDRNPAFAAFLDKAMVVTGVLVRQGHDAKPALEEWLQKSSEGPFDVTLALLPKQQRHAEQMLETKGAGANQSGVNTTHKHGDDTSTSEDSDSEEEEEDDSSDSDDSSSDEG